MRTPVPFEEIVDGTPTVRWEPATASAVFGDADLGIPPTNKSIEVNAIDIFEFRDGKITQSWNGADRAGMMQQLGIAPKM